MPNDPTSETRKPGQVPDDTKESLEQGQEGTQTRKPDEKAEPRRTGTTSTGTPPAEGGDQPAQPKAPSGGSQPSQ